MPCPTDYLDGTYLQQNPDWHVSDSPWKVRQLLRILTRNQIVPKTIYEAGCGAGEVLRLLQESLQPDCEFWGTDISSQAIELRRPRANEKLHFAVSEYPAWDRTLFELAMAIDVVAHIEDYRNICFERKV